MFRKMFKKIYPFAVNNQELVVKTCLKCRLYNRNRLRDATFAIYGGVNFL